MKAIESAQMLSANKLILIITTVVVIAAIWHASSSNSCPGSWQPSSAWSDCIGSVTFTNGDKLSGRFEYGKIAGTATYTFASGDRYVGELSSLRDVDGIRLTGKGTYFYSNGSRYVGEMLEGKFNGHGTLYYFNGDKYVGQFRDDRLNGSGAITYADGSSYIGEFKNDVPTGRGRSSSAPLTIKLAEREGLFELPVRLNDVITLNAVLDSGATDVSVPEDVYRTLRRAGTIADEDRRGEGIYTIADGSTQVHPKFRIRSVTVANTTIRGVEASVIPDGANADILLGQSFLRKFRSASIDYRKQTLTLSP